MSDLDTGKNKLAIWSQDRVLGFTDGIFGFSLTLLVLDLTNLNIPPGNQSLLPVFWTNGATLISFAVTFYMIARFWMSHTRLFSIIKEFDSTIVKLNNTLLFFITVFPFVATLLGTHVGNADAVIMYAGCFAIVGVLQYVIGKHAQKHKLFIDNSIIDDHFLKVFNLFGLVTPIVSLLSILIAFFSPTAAEIFWIVLLFLKIGFRRYYRNNHSAEIAIDII